MSEITQAVDRRRIGRQLILTRVVMLAAVISVVVLVVVPMTKRAREHARRSPCMSNLKQFGWTLNQYALDNGEQFPPRLETLWAEGYVTDPGLYVCPWEAERYGHDLPGEWPGGEQISDEYIAYCYVSGLCTADPAESVLAFDKEGNHAGHGINVLFIDGHVTWCADIGEVHDLIGKRTEELAAAGRRSEIVSPSWSRQRPSAWTRTYREARFFLKAHWNGVICALASLVIVVGIIRSVILIRRLGRNVQEPAE